MFKKSLWIRFKQIVWERLVEPIRKSHAEPTIKARGVAVGLAWAMTPLVGIQMYLVLLTWGVCQKLKWSFSLPLALAWTWVTNVFTVPPVYYGFYVTGQWMRGANAGQYGTVKQIIHDTFLGDLSLWEQTVLFFKILVNDWGVSMAVGCLPWAFVFGLLGYLVTLKLEKKGDKNENNS